MGSTPQRLYGGCCDALCTLVVKLTGPREVSQDIVDEHTREALAIRALETIIDVELDFPPEL